MSKGTYPIALKFDAVDEVSDVSEEIIWVFMMTFVSPQSLKWNITPTKVIVQLVILSNVLQLYLITFLVNFSCELGQTMTR